jgi:hypothetical protein
MHLLQIATRKHERYEDKHHNYSYGRVNRGETPRLRRYALACGRAWMEDVGGVLVYDFVRQ